MVAPGHEHETPDQWLQRRGFFRTVTGHREVVDLLVEPRLHADFAGLFATTGVLDEELSEIMAAGILSLNGDVHKKYRATIADRFTPRAAERLRPIAAALVGDRIDSIVGPRCEFVADVAQPYVADAICAYVGFEAEHAGAILEAVEDVAVGTRTLPEGAQRSRQGFRTMVDYARQAIDRRRREPGDDILSAIAANAEDGTLPEAAAIGLIGCLLSAGHEPTANQLTIVVQVLSDRPELWDAVGSGSVGTKPVVEEILRHRSTNQGVHRRVVDTFEYSGAEFTQGEIVVADLDSANHDPRRYRDPDAVIPDRDDGGHLSFGFGAHYCLGAALARVQLQEALAAMTRTWRCPSIESVHERPSGGLIGPDRLDITIERRDGTIAR